MFITFLAWCIALLVKVLGVLAMLPGSKISVDVVSRLDLTFADFLSHC